ncbi:hypothetical protein NDU88_000728 [Pleurodeles waltl]|uniref:Uncharacterized protein n=1 Tax=Pleurodeles waltl TaxID=8319 RepID=A0AAV7KQ61_PLEWA|nr:hypothetical protein NDU88_000728 [Pleurodeles waltl]
MQQGGRRGRVHRRDPLGAEETPRGSADQHQRSGRCPARILATLREKRGLSRVKGCVVEGTAERRRQQTGIGVRGQYKTKETTGRKKKGGNKTPRTETEVERDTGGKQ